MQEVNVHEANEVCKQGIIALPCHMGQLHGRVENLPRDSRVINSFLVPSREKGISWTPIQDLAHQW